MSTTCQETIATRCLLVLDNIQGQGLECWSHDRGGKKRLGKEGVRRCNL